jgi:hypothetical protein
VRPSAKVSSVTGTLLVAVALLAGCTASGGAGPSSPEVIVSTETSTVTHTASSSPAAFTPAPARSVAPLPPGASPRRGEVEKPCPYIVSSQDQGPHSLADLEGDRVYRTTVITTSKPVGCRFYFWAPPYQAIADILPRTFGNPTQAHNAMVLTARAGRDPIGHPRLLPGVDAIVYRTRFFGPDGPTDWACVFNKGKVTVIVHTQQSNTSQDALNIARQIAPKF